ncbi:uncharacterized protein PHACADRAFT_125240 [Phanerochaete carnosa HHB-10118-sp]|uniref:Alpha/beta hydrolase fold-3 domain-containing protein n=1 Tax=Phanerochaete carnosa (strain HHB-10118-sp) TaxID=650164 RepID=K5W3H8_PHACS|nr:uncharacterized protein PHACADRAFT_125240 [Phanerochaete carnosa HHB-10118-sp]EKM53474.1 hypothetical protein PHACADRAFT_125240 [Phanerochaete carnosa HHB-10118-sp]
MPDIVTSNIPERIGRANQVDPGILNFLKANNLRLGGKEPFTDERRHHTEVLAVEPPQHLVHVRVEPLIVRGPVGDFNVRCYHPSDKKGAAFIYIHGGGWTVGSLPEFDTFFRIMAEESGVQVYAIEYHLAPEHKVEQYFLFEATLRWLHQNASNRSVDPNRISVGGDSAGGNMAAVTALRMRELKGPKIALQVLIYPEAKVPFETLAGAENCTGLYLETQGVLLFAWNVLPQGKNHTDYDITPLLADKTLPEGHRNLPKAFIITNGFDPLRDTGFEYAKKLKAAGNEVLYVNHEDLTHGFIQFTKWSKRAMEETVELARTVGKELAN